MKKCFIRCPVVDIFQPDFEDQDFIEEDEEKKDSNLLKTAHSINTCTIETTLDSQAIPSFSSKCLSTETISSSELISSSTFTNFIPTPTITTTTTSSSIIASSSSPASTSTSSPITNTAVPTISPQFEPSKDRFNYASFDCGALVRSNNQNAKSPNAILNNNKDTYLLSACHRPLSLIVELCQEILIDSIVLANFEYFSSQFKTVRIQISDRYPAKQWVDLAVLSAQNTRKMQQFMIEQPVIWTKFLKLEFLEYFGNEYYCPLTVLRVHGQTMLEDLRVPASLRQTAVSPKLSTSVTWSFPTFPTSLPDPNPISEETTEDDFARESVFKSILKRLLKLETMQNHTQLLLNHQLIEFQQKFELFESILYQRTESYLDEIAMNMEEGLFEMKHLFKASLDDMIRKGNQSIQLLERETLAYQFQMRFLQAQVFLLWFFVFLYLYSKWAGLRFFTIKQRKEETPPEFKTPIPTATPSPPKPSLLNTTQDLFSKHEEELQIMNSFPSPVTTSFDSLSPEPVSYLDPGFPSPEALLQKRDSDSIYHQIGVEEALKTSNCSITKKKRSKSL